MPRCTYGPATSASPLDPTVPTESPSRTDAPFEERIVPRCVSVTAYPSAVSIVTLRPEDGTDPAKETTPAGGVRLRSVERKRLDDRAVRGPRPGRGGAGVDEVCEDERGGGGREDQASH